MSLTLNGSAGVTTNSGAVYDGLQTGTAVASTSGTSIDFTGIPSWVKRITVMLQGVSTSGVSPLIIQLGSGSITNTGYIGYGANFSAGSIAGAVQTVGIPLINAVLAATAYSGIITVATLGSNAWSGNAVLGSNAAAGSLGGGSITLGGTLDRIRLTTVGGTDTFDAGTINIIYE